MFYYNYNNILIHILPSVLTASFTQVYFPGPLYPLRFSKGKNNPLDCSFN